MKKRILIPMVCLPFLVVGISLFLKAREESRRDDCLNNLKPIDSASSSWAMAFGKNEGDSIDQKVISTYINGGLRMKKAIILQLSTACLWLYCSCSRSELPFALFANVSETPT